MVRRSADGTARAYPISSGRSSSTSMITSAGRPARSAAVLIASADGASYRQYVFFLLALRNDINHLTPAASLTAMIPSAPDRVTSSCSAKFRSMTNNGMSYPPFDRTAECDLSPAKSKAAVAWGVLTRDRYCPGGTGGSRSSRTRLRFATAELRVELARV